MLKNRYEVKLEGLNLDRLLDKIRLENIPIYNVKRNSYKELIFSIDMKNYQKLFALPEMKQYTVETKAEKGIPKLKKRFVARLGLFIGTLVAVALIVVSQMFTFDIQITGLEEISEEEIVAVLKESGVKIGGINKSKVEDLEKSLMSNVDKISMVSVSKQGTTILVNVKEKTLLDVSYTPIYADTNMIISSIVVYGGTAMVKEGDVVKAGDMLVDCYVTINGERVECEPRAEIYADVWVTGRVTFSEHEEKLQRTGKKQVIRNYEIFSKQLFSNNKGIKFEKYEVEESEKFIFNGWFLPLKSKQKVYYELESVTIDREFEPEREKMLAESRVLAYNQIGNETVIEESGNVSKIGDIYYIQTFLKLNKRVV